MIVRTLIVSTAVLALVAAVDAPPANAANADRVVVTTQNVRYTLGPAHARHDIRQAADGSSIVLTQEMGLRRASRFAPRGWGTVHYAGIRRGDCATYFDRHEWRRVSSRAVPISWAPWRAGHRWALVTILRGDRVRLGVVCVHAFTRTESPARRAAFVRAMDRVRAIVAGLHVDDVVLGGDWNRAYPHRPRFPDLLAARPPRPTGSRGGTIDYLYRTRGDRLLGVRVLGGTYSDHNGVRVALGL